MKQSSITQHATTRRPLPRGSVALIFDKEAEISQPPTHQPSEKFPSSDPGVTVDVTSLQHRMGWNNLTIIELGLYQRSEKGGS